MVWFVLPLIISLMVSLFTYRETIGNKNPYGLIPWLVVSLFWVVRSTGEMIYWLNQQFSELNKNPIGYFTFNHDYPGETYLASKV